MGLYMDKQTAVQWRQQMWPLAMMPVLIEGIDNYEL